MAVGDQEPAAHSPEPSSMCFRHQLTRARSSDCRGETHTRSSSRPESLPDCRGPSGWGRAGGGVGGVGGGSAGEGETVEAVTTGRELRRQEVHPKGPRPLPTGTSVPWERAA